MFRHDQVSRKPGPIKSKPLQAVSSQGAKKTRLIIAAISLVILIAFCSWLFFDKASAAPTLQVTNKSVDASGSGLTDGSILGDSNQANPGQNPPADDSDSSQTSTANQTGTSSSNSQSATVSVYISGAVGKPGVVELPAGSRLIQAVELCGGLNSDAAAEYVNLAAPLLDGDHIHVPSRADLASDEKRQLLTDQGLLSTSTDASQSAEAGKSSSQPTSSSQSDTSSFPININKADAQALQLIPGVGPVTAQKIIDYRKQHGLFKTVDDLKQVSGIGDKRLADMRPYVSI